MQKEIIFKIEEFFDREVFSNTTQLIETFDGFSIITNRQEIILAISNEQQCCEDAGYFMTNDNIEDFLNSELLSIDFVDGELKTHTMKTTETITYQDGHTHSFERDGYFVDIKKNHEIGASENYALFVNIHTSKGQLQFVAYNAGNGYYGHSFELKSQQLKHSRYV